MSILKAALCAVSLALTSCATHSSPSPLPPSLCTEVRRAAPVPTGAGVVQPVTAAEIEAFRIFMTWVAETISIGEENAEKAVRARAACSKNP